MRNISLILFIVIHTLCAKAQQFGNEWIMPHQPYVKAIVSEEGLYQLTGENFRQAGWTLPISSKQLQGFHLGKEIALWVNDGNDGLFEATDTLRFYGLKNSGASDSLLYRPTSARANPYYSLYSDQTSYFFTIGETAGKRMATSQLLPPATPAETYHIEQQLQVFTSDYSFNNTIGLVPTLQQSYFEVGEGRTGKFIVSDTTATFPIRFSQRVTTATEPVMVNFRLNGRSRIPHLLTYQFKNNPPSDTLRFEAFGTKDIATVLPPNAIVAEQTEFTLQARQQIPLDWYSVTYIKTTYPQALTVGDASFKKFYPRSTTASSLTYQWDVAATTTVLAFTNPDEPLRILPSADKKWVVPNKPNTTILVAKNVRAATLEKVNWAKMDTAATYLFITADKFLEATNTYAAYRASATGGSYKPLVVTTESLYNQFNYGEKSPIALRNFAAYMLQQAKPSHLLLVGKATSFPDELRKNTYPDDVPTIGYPASDALLTAGLAGYHPNVLAIPTGRLSVTTPTQILSYLEKVKEFEAAEIADGWQKRLLHLSGGQTDLELAQLKGIIEHIEEIAEGQTRLLGVDVFTKTKQSTQEVEPVSIKEEVNEGVGMITYVGHGSASTLDFNFGFASPPTNGYANKGKYPIMFFNGCGVGNVFYRYNALSSDWILTPNKGAIAVLANSFWSYIYPTRRYLETFYDKLFIDPATVNKSLGQIQQAVHQNIGNELFDSYLVANQHQVILQGDPAIHVFPIKSPDYQVNTSSIFLSGTQATKPLATNDSLRVGVIVRNFGRYEKDQRLNGRVVVAGSGEAAYNFSIAAMPKQDTVYVQIPNRGNISKITVEVDQPNQIIELNEKNNIADLKITSWDEVKQLSSYPLNVVPDRVAPLLSVMVDNKTIEPNSYVAASPTIQITLIDNASLAEVATTSYIEVYLKRCATCNPEKIATQLQASASTLQQTAQATINNLAAGNYEVIVVGRDTKGNTAATYTMPFRVAAETLPASLSLTPNPTSDYVTIRYLLVQPQPSKEATLRIYASDGKLMHEATLPATVGANIYRVAASTLGAGTFIVKLWIDEKEVATQKLLIQ